MTKKDAKIGTIVQLAGRTAEIIAIRGDQAKIRPAGESSRWIKISELTKA